MDSLQEERRGGDREEEGERGGRGRGGERERGRKGVKMKELTTFSSAYSLLASPPVLLLPLQHP